jgi:hypothetical protein
MKALLPLQWKRGLPAGMKPGWYWVRSKDVGEAPHVRIVRVRLYVSELCIENSTLAGWEAMEKAEWAGPIPEPV